MSRIVDPQEIGIFPLQSFKFEEELIDSDQRHVLKGARVLNRDKDSHHFLMHHRVVDESVGSMSGPFLWLPQDEGVGDPKQFESEWRDAWPVVASTKDTENRLSETTGNVHAAAGDSVRVFPIFDQTIVPDTRFAFELPFLGKDEKCRVVPAGGVRGIVLDSMFQDSQEPIFFFGDGRIVAPHHGREKPGSKKFGTIVADLTSGDEIDPKRCARLQSIFRNIKNPNSDCADFKGENSIALNITEGGLSDVHGGLWIDKSSGGGGGSTTSEDVPTEPGGSREPPGPDTASRGTGEGRGNPSASAGQEGGFEFGGVETVQNQGGLSGGDGDPNPATDQPDETGDGPGQTVTGTPLAIGMFSHHQGGPLDAGSTGDKHKIGTDGDGNAINSGHLSLGTLFRRSQIEDGPFKYDGIATYPVGKKPANYVEPPPHFTDVFFEFDRSIAHSTPCGVGSGSYRWRAPLFTYIPEGPPPPPPPPPPEDGFTSTPELEFPDDMIPPHLPEGDPVETPGTPDDGPPELPPVETESADISPEGRRRLREARERIRREGLRSVHILEPLERERFTANLSERAMPALLARPQRIADGEIDFRTVFNLTAAEIASADKTVPITGRMEAYGAQGGLLFGPHLGDQPAASVHTAENPQPWTYTQTPGSGRFIGGTASGGWNVMSPEIDTADLALITKIDTPTEQIFGWPIDGKFLSNVYMNFVPETFTSWAFPEFATGGIFHGYRAGSDGAGSLIFECVDLDGVDSDVLTMDENCRVKFGARVGDAQSQVEYSGSMGMTPTTITANLTLSEESVILVDATSVNIIATLPDVTTVAGRHYFIKKIDSSARTVTIAAGGYGDTIEGASTVVLSAQWDCREVYSTGTEWVILCS